MVLPIFKLTQKWELDLLFDMSNLTKLSETLNFGQRDIFPYYYPNVKREKKYLNRMIMFFKTRQTIKFLTPEECVHQTRNPNQRSYYSMKIDQRLIRNVCIEIMMPCLGGLVI